MVVLYPCWHDCDQLDFVLGPPPWNILSAKVSAKYDKNSDQNTESSRNNGIL